VHTLCIVVVWVAVIMDVPLGMLQDEVKFDGGKGVGRQNISCKHSKLSARSPVHAKGSQIKTS